MSGLFRQSGITGSCRLLQSGIKVRRIHLGFKFNGDHIAINNKGGRAHIWCIDEHNTLHQGTFPGGIMHDANPRVNDTEYLLS